MTLAFVVENLSARAIPYWAVTVLLAYKSFLLAKIILGTPGGAFSAICAIHVFKF